MAATRISPTALIAGAFAVLAGAGELYQYVRGDFEWLGGAFLLLVIGAAAAASLTAGLTRKPGLRLTLLAIAAPLMWAFGLIGVFSSMFLLLLGAPFASAAAVTAAARSAGAARALLVAGGIAIAAIALVALAVALT